jgi:serine protease Do
MEVDPKGAAGEAGLQKGDVITSINGEKVDEDAQLAEMIARQKPGDAVKITYARNGAEKTVNVVLKAKMGEFASAKSAAVESMGADFTDLSKDDAAKLGIDGGVVVGNLHEGGVLSSQTNMHPGFIITKVGDLPVKSVDEFRDALSKQNSNFQLQGVYPDSKEVYYYGINDFKK